jgi:hypothetical protein
LDAKFDTPVEFVGGEEVAGDAGDVAAGAGEEAGTGVFAAAGVGEGVALDGDDGESFPASALFDNRPPRNPLSPPEAGPLWPLGEFAGDATTFGGVDGAYNYIN